MAKHTFVGILALCFVASISADVWKASNGKGPEMYLDMSVEDLKKQCETKQKGIRDTRIYAPYFKLYKEIQEDIVKKMKADSKTNVDNLIKEQCLMHAEFKKQITNVTDTVQLCLDEKDRVDKAMKDKIVQKVLETKCDSLKKIVTIRAEETCIKKEPPMCLEMMTTVPELLIPIPVKYTPQLCREIENLTKCRNYMKDCKEESRKAMESYVADEMMLVQCPITV